MEMYIPFEHENAENYLIQVTEPNKHLTAPLLEQLEPMYNGGATEFLVEQGLYYPTTPINYGYYCTGSDSPSEWDDHQRFFGLDGLDVQHTGAQTENLPYVYYTPSYGYTESPYNPYNPYIPGAMIGVDVPFVGTQHYYAIPPYQTTVSSPAYFPVIAHSRADTIPASSQALVLDTGASSTNTAFSSNIKHNLSSASPILYMTPQGPSTNQARSFTNVSDVARANVGPSKQAVMHGSISSSGFRNPDSVHSFQRRGASVPNQSLGNISNVKVLSNSNQLKVALPFSCGLSDFSSSAHQRVPADKVQSNFHYGTTLNGVNGNLDALNQQNHCPRTSRLKKLLAVKSYTTKVGDGNAEGNIIIYTDQYNKDDFSVNYMDAKFFVIKSYSEDDVHKSVKYNLWSSTPNGNKKLNRIYEDAQRMQAAQSRPCPVFMFFSVNASGQFCGVAEMIGPVDFQKDMDFWQQDKWSGSFPVKWHIIKDVPNTNFRHILLENNEYKPVTSSRDTQEIRYKPGLEMLRIFKNYALKTSLLDDFLYYENRQKFMQEEKARLPVESYGNSFFITPMNPPRKHSSGVDIRPSVEERISQHNKVNLSDKAMVTTSKHVSWTTVPSSTCKDENDEHVAAAGAKDNIVSALAVGSLSLNPKQDESNPVTTTSGTPLCTQLDDVVTIGSMPVKVNGHSESSRFLRVGTISLDPKALYPDKGGDSAKLDLDT